MINIEHVTKVYPNGTIGVEDININIEKGEFVFLVGSSGSGKSTMIKLLLKELDPTEGTITINSVKTGELRRSQIPYLRRNVGVEFQDFRLLPNKTVFENVAFAMQVIEAPTKTIRRNVPTVLSLVGLRDKSKVYPRELSGGEQQRTALARAIVNNPPILIADEPTGNLDSKSGGEVMKMLCDLRAKMKKTLIVITHDPHIAEMAERRFTIIDGVLSEVTVR